MRTRLLVAPPLLHTHSMDVLLKGPRCYPVGELLSWVHKNEDLRSDIPAGTLFDAYSDPFTRLQDDQ
eukprot:scaffold204228_cov23-Tisochrysis_lutea.AAC.1